MPKPRREDHTVRLTTYEVENARRLATRQNRPFADVLSEAVGIGLDVLIERDNRVNVWLKTGLRGELAKLVEGMSPEELEQVITAIKSQQEEG